MTSECDTNCTLEDFNFAFSLDCVSIPDSIPICKKHRAEIFNPKERIKCSFCGSQVKSKKYFCHSLSKESILKLKEVNDEFVFNDGSILCASCQRFALREHSTECLLKELEQSFLLKCQQYEPSDDLDHVLFDVLNSTFLHLCSLCNTNKGFLLSTAYEYFLEVLKRKVPEKSLYYRLIRTKTFLHTKIVENFGKILIIHKSARKKGILFYVSDISMSDLIEAWHTSCFESRLLKNKCDESGNPRDDEYLQSPSSSSVEIEFRSIIGQCNSNLRTQSKQIRDHFLTDPSHLIDFTLTDLTSFFNPLVWNVICLLTATKEEFNHFTKSSFSVEKEYVHFPTDNTKSGQSRRQRRITAICFLQFILNEENSYPVHILTGTCIQRLTRSSKLLKIFNRFGFSCSKDTLNRFWHEVFARREKNGLLSELIPEAFTLISIDNIDVLSPFAAVTIDSSRSWHGTSIMAQQPKPITEKSHSLEKLSEDQLNIDSDIEQEFQVGAHSSESSIPNVKKPRLRRKLSLHVSGDSSLPAANRKDFQAPYYKTFIRSQLTIEYFEYSNHDKKFFEEGFFNMFVYVAERYYSLHYQSSTVIPSFKCKLAMVGSHETEKSNFSYLHVLDEKADSPNTLMHCLGILYKLFEINKNNNHLVVAGDGATIKMLINMKREYGEVLDWVIPFLGDWHVLKNFQEVIMKIFWDAGLKDLAKLAHKQMTLQSLASCSNFKRTHRFILQSYEAIFMCLLSSFLQHRKGTEVVISNDDFLKQIENVVCHLEYEDGKHKGVDEFFDAELHFIHSVIPFVNEFNAYCEEMSSKYETFRFWNQFVREDCLSYINLHIAIRTGNWNLRLASFKKMIPLFQAFDRQNYSTLIPGHLSMICGFPDYIREHFEKGAFVASISGKNFSHIGLDEAHEMLINRDCKMALTHSLPKDMNTLAGTLENQAKMISTLEDQLGITKPNKYQRDLDLSVIKLEFDNVKSYFEKLSNTQIFHSNQSACLSHIFTEKPATAVQQQSLLNFRKMGKMLIWHIVKCSYWDRHLLKNQLQESFDSKLLLRKKLEKKRYLIWRKKKN
ncbi:uncharacterized protein LOC121405715 isoform X1 [Lytechinus variegatus]|uniref:uncharacterized protein LOC121405715 isoform X1 n=1 Tax=Lytechinus variegatus TaxID=7654 RepID=UPI001BB0F4BD|nr:uncharacterized protein LOC121405715 isoform X1 [Lytechinus variegatus]XP_041452571.1 uncharacterized protein LOC121405715 isoform X1 [Lytechinus variegatus]